MSELERYKLLLFMTVRNNTVLPTGIELGKTEEEISKMTIDVIDKMGTMIDFRRAKELYKLGEWL